MKKKGFFYGWVVIACCTMLAFSVNAMGNNTLTFYVTSLSETFKVNRATVNFSLFTIGLFTRTVIGLFFGRLARRFGVKRLMVIGFAFVLAGFAAYSFAGSIAMISLGSALYGVAHAIGTLSSYNVIINNWFSKNKGMMLGILNTAIGVGGMVINPLVSNWIQRFGWNLSFLNTAFLIAAIAIPALVFIREAPPKAEPVQANASKAIPVQLPDGEKDNLQQMPVMTLRRALRVNRFWLLVAVQLLIGFSIGPSFSNAIPALRAMEVDTKLVSGLLSVFIAFGIAVGHLASGFIFDRFGLKPLMYAIVGIVSTGLILMSQVSARTPVLLLVMTVICIGYGNALTLGTLSHMINSVFSAEQKDFSGLFGCLFAVQNIGIMIGSPISGMVFDSTGSYQIAYELSCALLVLMLILLGIALRVGKAIPEKRINSDIPCK